MDKRHLGNPWARYADDAVIHCRTEEEAKEVLRSLKDRLRECGLGLNPDKTKIVYCKSDINNKENCGNESFDFLGYTFRARNVKTRYGTFFRTFSPAVSNSAKQSLREKLRQLRKDISITTHDEVNVNRK